jgi:hypothetical protein
MSSVEFGYWVKPRSIIWFSNFLLVEFEEDRWLENFQMNKVMLFSITDRLKVVLQIQNTKYRQSIPIEIPMCCTIFKLAQSANFIICNEFFTIGKLIVFLVLHEFVATFISTYNDLIIWPRGEALAIVMDDLKIWCGFPSVQGAIDGTHISIVKLVLFLED